MDPRDKSLPNKNALKRFRVALWVCGVLGVTLAGAALYAGHSVYTNRFGLAPTAFLIVFGLFFLALAISWRPKTRN